MQLTTEDGTLVNDPTIEQLLARLARRGLPGNGYAVLAPAVQEYLQVTGSRADGYVAEYREGTYRSLVTNLSHRQMVELMTQYLEDGAWKQSISWVRAYPVSNDSGSWLAKHGLHAICRAVGVAALAVGAQLGHTTYRFVERADELPGKVVQMVERHRRGKLPTYAPVVEFIDREGRVRTFQSEQASRPPSFYEGEVVTVLYDPAHSSEPKIKTSWEVWG